MFFVCYCFCFVSCGVFCVCWCVMVTVWVIFRKYMQLISFSDPHFQQDDNSISNCLDSFLHRLHLSVHFVFRLIDILLNKLMKYLQWGEALVITIHRYGSIGWSKPIKHSPCMHWFAANMPEGDKCLNTLFV